MKCWIMSEKRWGDTAEEIYEVEWQIKHPKYDSLSESDRDCFDPAQHPHHYKHFAIAPGTRSVARTNRDVAKQRAVAFAESVTEAFFGVVTVQRMALEQVDGTTYDWDGAGEAIEVEPKQPA